MKIFPNESATTRLAWALMLEQNDVWIVCRRYMSSESLAAIRDDETIGLSDAATWSTSAPRGQAF